MPCTSASPAERLAEGVVGILSAASPAAKNPPAAASNAVVTMVRLFRITDSFAVFADPAYRVRCSPLNLATIFGNYADSWKLDAPPASRAGRAQGCQTLPSTIF